MTTANIQIDGKRMNWSALTVVSSPAERPAPTFGIRRSGADLEQADMVAARQTGDKRRQAAGQGANAKSATEGHGWLAGDPFRWRGRKVMQRASGSVYTVRQVFNSGKVELQKKFMLYLSSVDVIRKDYEPTI